MSESKQVPLYERYALCAEDTALVFNIGINKIYELIHANPKANWILRNGRRTLIKRKQFEKWLDELDEI